MYYRAVHDTRKPINYPVFYNGLECVSCKGEVAARDGEIGRLDSELADLIDRMKSNQKIGSNRVLYKSVDSLRFRSTHHRFGNGVNRKESVFIHK